MSAATSIESTGAPAAQVRRAVRVEPVTLARVVRSEWLKFRTLRSTLAVLAAACLGMFGVALIVAGLVLPG